MSGPTIHPDSHQLLQKMRQFSEPTGQLNFRDFMQHALYDPEFGYYRKNTQRVGRSAQADFYTSQSIGPVFGALVFAAIQKLIFDFNGTTDLSSWTLVEIGYESDAKWWKDGECPFGKVQQIGPDDSLNYSGNCVVFSNELFDAQPFHRLVFIDGQWLELGVDVSEDHPREVILSELSSEVSAFLNQLPLTTEPGYLLDLPLNTQSLLKEIATPDWQGLFVALDYGKSWDALTHDFPNGTARAYFKHQQSPNLIAQPGFKDLTCHICWDWMKEGLELAGFQNVTLESQEAFFVKHASKGLQKIVTANEGKFDPDRQSMMQLIHPATMGQQFQALWGYR